MLSIDSFVTSFVTLFIIMDPFASIPYFLALTNKLSKKEAVRAANKAILLAGVIAVLFLFTGPTLLGFLGVTLSDFRVAGGIILALLGLEMVLGFSFSPPNATHDWNSIAVLVATPLLTGPGLMSSLLILSEEYGYAAPLAGTGLALALSWVLIRNAELFREKVGRRPIAVLSKIFGLILLTIAVNYVRLGLAGI